MVLRRKVLFGWAGLALAGCSSGAPSAVFDLNAPAAPTGVVRVQGAARGRLTIAEPTAQALLDTDRIVVRTSAAAVAYLSGAQWSERLPKLVQTRLIQSFESGRTLRAVGRPGDLVSHYALTIEIRRFEFDVDARQARVALDVRLVDGGGLIAADKAFSASAPADTTESAAISAALDQALAQTMSRIVAWAAPRA